MSTATASQGRSSAADLRAEMLDRLGLGPDANDQEVESAHRDLTAFLEGAPEGLSGWAALEAGQADEAFALLTGPESALREVARERYAASVRARVPAGDAEVPAPGRPSRLPWYLLGVLALVAVVVGVWYVGRPSVPDMSSASSASASASPTMDSARLAALTQKVKENPKDATSLQGIADLYFQVGDYSTAASFSQKALDSDPKNEAALLSLGAAQFNQGDTASAEKTWTGAAKLYPKNQEVHYDLGFLYMTLSKTEQMNEQWQQVLAIDPASDLAKTVSSHLGSTPSPSTGS